MAVKKEEPYKKYLVYLKDLVYIAGIVIAVGGWLQTKSRSQAILETTVQNNTKTLEKFESFIEKQAELNGKFIQFMSSDIHN